MGVVVSCNNNSEDRPSFDQSGDESLSRARAFPTLVAFDW